MDPSIGSMARRGVFPLVSVVTLSLEFTVTIFAGIALSEEEGVSKSYTNTSISAVSFSGLSVVSILGLSTIHISRLRYPWLYHGLLPLTGAAFGLIGAVLALNALLIERTNAGYFATTRELRVSTSTRIAVWAVAGCFQLAFYTMLAFMRNPTEDSAPTRSSGIGLAQKRRQPPRPPTPPTPLRIVAPPFALPQASKPLELPPSPKRNSWRDTLSSSLHQVVRPANSRSRLLDRQMTVKTMTTTSSTTRTTTARSSMSRDSQSLSETKSIANSDDFPWDLHLPPSSSGGSSPEAQIRDMLASTVSPVAPPGPALLPPMPHALPSGRAKPFVGATPLEPIPGSRPVSPAKTLDMYTDGTTATSHGDDFHFGIERAGTPASVATIRPPTAQSMASTIVPASSTAQPSAPRRLSRPSTPSLASTSSISLPFAESTAPHAPGADEAHIPPHVRSDSPSPPPVASPGTVVTASPLSGQVLPQAGRASRSASPRPSLASTRRTPSRASSRLGASSSTPDGDEAATAVAAGVGRSATRSTRSASSASLARGAGLDAGPIPPFVLEAKRERII